jgi:hypothetical protein
MDNGIVLLAILVVLLVVLIKFRISLFTAFFMALGIFGLIELVAFASCVLYSIG